MQFKIAADKILDWRNLGKKLFKAGFEEPLVRSLLNLNEVRQLHGVMSAGKLDSFRRRGSKSLKAHSGEV
jgi:hypothetical protein